jgi:HD superfamily phosphodiesterase
MGEMAEDRGKDTSDGLQERLRRIETCCRGRLRHLDSELHSLRHLREVALLAGRIAAGEWRRC